MTQIDFYTSAPDKLKTACRIIAKAYGLGHKILVFCPDAETSQHCDRLLWTTPPTGFIPHCFPAHPLARKTSIIIDDSGEEPLHDGVLLNLRNDWPPFFGRFKRLIEIVTLDSEDQGSARTRYRFYRDRGYDIRTHDLGKSS